MRSLTDEVIDFILDFNSPPQKVRVKAVEHIVDGIAVMIAGSRTLCSERLAEFIRERRGKPVSTVIGYGFRSCPSDAAMVNGTSGHADDYDDTQLSTSPDRIYGLLTHPTVPLLAATIATGELVECSGLDLLDAFIVGFEVECKLAETIKPSHYKRGFHTTGTIGAFGAFAASGKLLKLGETELRHALGIVASLTSGIRVNFGTMTKPLHAGMAASNGVTASLLAQRGFTADKNALDGRWGFMEILGHGADPEYMMGKMGNPYALINPGATFKMYPCGCLGQPSMDAMLDLVLEMDLKPEDVKGIMLRAGPNILEPLRYSMPVTGLQAKFSLNFALASILLHRKAGLREYTTEFVTNPKVVNMMKRIKTVHDTEIASLGVEKMRSILEVELVDGQVIKRTAEEYRGTPEKPFVGHEVKEKFLECASFMMDEGKAHEILRVIQRLEDLSDIGYLTNLLSRET
jgi:2-methylcitrate dehydratase PrpD